MKDNKCNLVVKYCWFGNWKSVCFGARRIFKDVSLRGRAMLIILQATVVLAARLNTLSVACWPVPQLQSDLARILNAFIRKTIQRHIWMPTLITTPSFVIRVFPPQHRIKLNRSPNYNYCCALNASVPTYLPSGGSSDLISRLYSRLFIKEQNARKLPNNRKRAPREIRNSPRLLRKLKIKQWDLDFNRALLK